jgi:ankyrin repeat protein
VQIKLESTPDREKALFDLMSTTNLAAISNLLDIGTNPNAIAIDRTGRTPLHVAAQSGNAGVVLYLLEAGANVNVRDALGMTPLHYAAQYADLATRLLIERGAVADARNIENSTPLHCAAKKGLATCVKALLDSGADVNAVQKLNGSSALHVAACEGNAGACVALLAAGARVNGFNANDQTPLHIAAARGHLAACRALVDGGGDPDLITQESLYRPLLCLRSPLQEAVVNGQTDVVEYFLLSCRANHQLTSRGGETLTGLARGRAGILRILRAIESQSMLEGVVSEAFEDVSVAAPTVSKGLSPI